MDKTIFVTVGTTHFDALSQAVCSKEFQERALELGYTSLILQYGRSALSVEETLAAKKVLAWEAFEFTDRMAEYMARADVIISHCGSGTVLDILRGPIFGEPVSKARQPSLILVPNPSLMDNHQLELAGALVGAGVALLSTAEAYNISDQLAQVTTHSIASKAKVLPPPAIGRLSELIRKAIG